MEAEGEESDDAAQGDMRNLHLNDGLLITIAMMEIYSLWSLYYSR